MANLLIHDIPAKTESAIREFAARNDLTLSEAAIELLQMGIAESSKAMDEKSAGTLGVGDFLAETLKEALHTEDEAEEFIRSHEEMRPSENRRLLDTE